MLDAGARRALAGTRFGDVRWHDEVGSTNRVVLDLARQGAAEGIVVGADHQTAGRGRLDRVWAAPPGSSLLLSVLTRPVALAPEHVHMATMAMGVAAADAVAEVAGFRPQLKWPNDLVVDDRKLAGILAEGVVTGSRVEAVVLGIGLNVNWPSMPAELVDIAVSANQVAGHDVDRRDLLVCLLQRFDEHYGALLEHGGWRGMLLNYRRSCSTLGREVRVELPGSAITGRAVEVTAEGHLVVETPTGLEHVAAGDVVHVRPA
ncbi:MAG: birA, biotin-(acetyl-CoA-carboxylase) ligase [Acidimicrobiales bacterium]|jgi:BirA family biotin operon repressor/biotin-[acetyl-CoA-carboxylase] ligase|nr:birA, biotin-(acetyl-CoA-carboxylase) ligase [Acidimicrobiales bacterium]